MSYNPDILIYHSPCHDGFGSALAVHMKYGADRVLMMPMAYGDKVDMERVRGKDVLIADFSFPWNVMEQLGRVCRSVVVLDHHKTAEEELARFPQFTLQDTAVDNIELLIRRNPGVPVVCFSKSMSGAMMTWEFLYPDVYPRPFMIELIQDRDLWHFNKPASKPFHMWLQSKPTDLEKWAEILRDMEVPHLRESIIVEALSIERFFNKKCEEVAEQATIQNIGHYVVPVANANWCFSSEVGHLLLERFPLAPFSATYFDDGKFMRKWSLRSRDDREDCSAIAKRFGGGGHRNAAGFTTVPNKWPE